MFGAHPVGHVGSLDAPTYLESMVDRLGEWPPGVVVAGMWTSVKELMADRKAQRLAEPGYATLSFDFTGFGESEGEPRDVEDPARKVRDIHQGVGFLAGHPAVDGQRLGALGICAAAMYMADNAARDQRVGSLALVAPWFGQHLLDRRAGRPRRRHLAHPCRRPASHHGDQEDRRAGAAILLTHSHPDHVGGAGAFHDAFPRAPIHASRSTDRAMREDERGFYPLAHSANPRFPTELTYADRTVADGATATEEPGSCP